MTPAQTVGRADVKLEEPFRHYTGDWTTATSQTDPPDLMGLFRDAEEAAAYAEMDDAMAQIHADLADASFRSFPGE